MNAITSLDEVEVSSGYPLGKFPNCVLRIRGTEIKEHNENQNMAIYDMEIVAPETAPDADGRTVKLGGNLAFKLWTFLPKNGLNKKGDDSAFDWKRVKVWKSVFGVSTSPSISAPSQAWFDENLKGRGFLADVEISRKPKRVQVDGIWQDGDEMVTDIKVGFAKEAKPNFNA